jgi:hypothetical protein
LAAAAAAASAVVKDSSCTPAERTPRRPPCSQVAAAMDCGGTASRQRRTRLERRRGPPASAPPRCRASGPCALVSCSPRAQRVTAARQECWTRTCRLCPSSGCKDLAAHRMDTRHRDGRSVKIQVGATLARASGVHSVCRPVDHPGGDRASVGRPRTTGRESDARRGPPPLDVSLRLSLSLPLVLSSVPVLRSVPGRDWSTRHLPTSLIPRVRASAVWDDSSATPWPPGYGGAFTGH